MLQSHLGFRPYIQCVCFRISKKTGGNQEINSINSVCFFSQPHVQVSGCCSLSSQSQQEQNCMWVKRDCSVFGQRECFNQAAWAEIILREHSAGGVSGLLFSQARVPAPGLASLEEKSAGAKWQTDALCAWRQAGTLLAPRVFRFTFSPTSGMTKRGFVSKWVSKLTRRGNHFELGLDRGEMKTWFLWFKQRNNII